MHIFGEARRITERYPDNEAAATLCVALLDRVLTRGYVEPMEGAMDDVNFDAERKRQKAESVAESILRACKDKTDCAIYKAVSIKQNQIQAAAPSTGAPKKKI